MKTGMRTRLALAGTLALVLALGVASVAICADNLTETHAYFSVVHEPYEPYAPYTDARETSLLPYFSVVHEPYE